MTTFSKSLLAFAAIGALAGLIAFFNFSPFHTEVAPQVAGSSAGASYNTAKVAEQVVTTATSTVFVLTNNDASDRTITSARLMLKNAVSTTTTIVVACATSTSAVQANGNTNYILNMTFSGGNISQFGTTTSAGTFIASSSPGITGTSTIAATQNLANPFARNWAAGTNLYCGVTTGDGTNTLPSGTTGYIAFPYEGQ